MSVTFQISNVYFEMARLTTLYEIVNLSKSTMLNSKT